MLDGEGGFPGLGHLSLAQGNLPLGLASDVALARDIAEGQPLKWSDVSLDPGAGAVKVRREMEAAFAWPNR